MFRRLGRGGAALLCVVGLAACSGDDAEPQDVSADLGQLPDPRDGTVGVDTRVPDELDADVRPREDQGPPPPPPQCSDGIDNDGDGLIDYPADPGCASPDDDDETTPETGPARPQCADQIDNDGDGFVDLADPGCATLTGARERTPDELPACFNGLDDDGDGLVDFPYDPGCMGAGGADEADPPTAPQCANGLDDDADGLVDFPFDPGCAGRGGRTEVTPDRMPACADGLDNDRDGLIDYPADRGCQSAADTAETGNCGRSHEAVELTAGRVFKGTTRGGTFTAEGSCGGRGANEVVFAYRVDEPLDALIITTELPETAIPTTLHVRRACLNPDSEIGCQREAPNSATPGHTLRVERVMPGLLFIFVDGVGPTSGVFALRVDEEAVPECRNGADDDGDGLIDYPNDPGCDDPDDLDETSPDPLPQCANGIDDDEDGLIDYPADPGCIHAGHPDETDLCPGGIRVVEYPHGAPFIQGDTSEDNSRILEGSCGGSGSERVVVYRNPYNAKLTLSVNHPETLDNTLLYVHEQCGERPSELGCAATDPASANSTKGRLVLDRVQAGLLFIVIDHAFGIGGAFKLSIQSERLPPACSDGVDNDEDGFVDGEDPGCAGPDDEDERDPPADAPRPACYDRLDNDEDGLVDYPFDPGCLARGDDDEEDPAELPACANQLDDDGDGLVDFPADRGCYAASDSSEVNPRQNPQCSNRLDDDNDGLTDFPFDPGCSGPGDLSEKTDALRPFCSDGEDNDRDGLTDFPFDPGCLSAGHMTEVDTVPLPQCSDGRDNDGDGLADFPSDPGCPSAAHDDETTPAARPQCSDGADNDRNGLIDWPNDPNCDSAGDPREAQGRRRRTQCGDALDNDGDGLVDLADPGCVSRDDDDETTPEELPACADGQDNDGDGLIDWPADLGCASRGDECEQRGFGICEGVCMDLLTDADNCGRCDRVCNPGVECIRGVCGGLMTFEGIRQNVPNEELDGWRVCHLDLFADSNAEVDRIVADCGGEYVMYGCRRVNSPTWQLLAMGERETVFTNTGDQGNVLIRHNEVDWYFSRSYSIGFVAPGSGVSRNSCDTHNVQPEQRLCWHTGNGRLTGGYRCGANVGLNGSREYERAVFTSD